MSEPYVKRVEFTHGVIMGEDVAGKPAYRGAGELVNSYTHELIMPVGGISSVTLRVATVKEALTATAKARRDHAPGSNAFADALFRNMLDIQAEETVTEEMLKEMAGADWDELKFIVNRGVRPSGPKSGQPVFTLDLNKSQADHSRTAFVRLHTGRDRYTAEANMKVDKEEDPVSYEVQLAFLITHIGDGEPDFRRRGDLHSFLSLTWPDFQALTAEVYARDYLQLSEVLRGDVTTDGGVTLPFRELSEEGSEGSQDESQEGAA